MIVCSFLVENLSPIIIKEKRAKGNFFESLDYIPASTLLGAIATRILEKYCPNYDGSKPVNCNTCNKTNCMFKKWIYDNNFPWLSHAYPTNKNEAETLINPPSLETLYSAIDSNGKEEFADFLLYKLTIKRFLNIKHSEGFSYFRNKPPKYWEIEGGHISKIDVKFLTFSHVAIDPRTKSTFLKSSNGTGEPSGLLFTVKAIQPKHRFMFKALCNSEEDYSFIMEALKEGVWVGMGKSRGYGEIRLVHSLKKDESTYKEERLKEIKEFSNKAKNLLRSLNSSLLSSIDDSKDLIIVDGLTHLSRNISNEIPSKDRLLYQKYHLSEAVTLRLGNMIKISSIRPGSVLLLESNNLNQYVDLELTPPQNAAMRWAGFGWLEINHPVHLVTGIRGDK
ncbi:MAG: RAMP superfamily CRISPR-associated protein [Thermoproteota archaeon]